MSFCGILMKVEDAPDGNRAAGGFPEQTYPRWKMTVYTDRGFEQSACSGRGDVIARARQWIGTPVCILRGGKAGIVGGIHELTQSEMADALTRHGWKQPHAFVFERPSDKALFRGPALAYKILCGVGP